MKAIILLLSLAFSVIHCDEECSVEDPLEKLILKTVDQAISYDFPKSNIEYFEGLEEDKIHEYGTFDFIIVGSGSSGSVLVNRLSEVKSWKVLLLEAGGEYDSFLDIPSMYIYAQNSKHNWGYNTTSQKYGCKDFGEYDFIIVGAGSSGSVIFNRLSEVKKWKILLLEAGGDEDDFSDIPAMMFFTHLSEMNWGYNTTSQKKSCLGMNDNQCSYPRGRVVGGSGTINALMNIRGSNEDFDIWEKQGNPGWSYKNVLPYFKKSEHFEIQDADSGYHSTSGMWNVSYVDPPTKLTKYFMEASKETGGQYVDYNGKNQMGYSRLQMSINKGRRASGGRTFIDPVRHEPNVNIVTNALVTKILIDSDKKVYGVEFLKNGRLLRTTSKKEVILSAGAINTPQLLMLSGIGPKTHLEALKIPVVEDLPVGQKFQDHISYIALNVRTNMTYQRRPIRTVIKNFLRGKGLFTYGANTQAINFINTSDHRSTKPDIELILIASPSTSILASKVYNLKPEFAKMAQKEYNGDTDFKIYVVLMHPKSVGEVTLKSNNPLDFPNIDPNYFSDEHDEDIETMYRGIKYAVSMLKTNAFAGIDAKLQGVVPVCDKHVFLSKEYYYCTIRHLSSTLYHPTGTTRMGPNTSTSVVNHELKVHGIKNLRIGDCGVIPISLSGHTNAPAVMIGEKLADLIKRVHL
ncbi:hypothetical protein WA026_009996 [Henosepilachna vigintioctopunctata]|uniref:Glucose-methanol-choline oxidoreductase N-terminal domain-containing protein n=1 Tax=Henosepilachna vigintioctopunctata TaxID=420089 RepID=A0AAW1TRH2_9CUCU